MVEDLTKFEVSREEEATKAAAFKEKFKKTLASLKEPQVENEKPKSVIRALEVDLEAHREGVNDYVVVSRSLKDSVLEQMRSVRTDAV